MSVKGYKLIEIRHEESPTFNFANEEINFWLAEIGAFESLDVNGCGLIHVSRKCIEMALEDNPESRFSSESIAVLRQMLAECGEDYVSYYCF